MATSSSQSLLREIEVHFPDERPTKRVRTTGVFKLSLTRRQNALPPPCQPISQRFPTLPTSTQQSPPRPPPVQRAVPPLPPLLQLPPELRLKIARHAAYGPSIDGAADASCLEGYLAHCQKSLAQIMQVPAFNSVITQYPSSMCDNTPAIYVWQRRVILDWLQSAFFYLLMWECYTVPRKVVFHPFGVGLKVKNWKRTLAEKSRLAWTVSHPIMGLAAEYDVLPLQSQLEIPTPRMRYVKKLTLVLEDDYELFDHSLRLLCQKTRPHLESLRVVIMLTRRLAMDANAVDTAELLSPTLHTQPHEGVCRNVMNRLHQFRKQLPALHLVFLEVRKGQHGYYTCLTKESDTGTWQHSRRQHATHQARDPVSCGVFDFCADFWDWWGDYPLSLLLVAWSLYGLKYHFASIGWGAAISMGFSVWIRLYGLRWLWSCNRVTEKCLARIGPVILMSLYVWLVL